MKKLKLIRDGMTKPFRLAPWGPGEEVLVGVFRPMSSREVAAYRAAVRRAEDDDKPAVAAKALAARIASWEVEGDHPPTAEAVLALPDAFLAALENVVTGYAGSAEAEADEKKSASPQS